MRNWNRVVGASLCAMAGIGLLASCGAGQGQPEVQATISESVEAEDTVRSIPVGNTRCPVMGAAVVPGQSFEWEGFQVGICCPGCETAFQRNVQTYLPYLLEDPGVTDEVRAALAVHLDEAPED